MYGPVITRSDGTLVRRDAPPIDFYGRFRSIWLVDVHGYDTVRVSAFTRDQARYMAFVAFHSAYGGTFRDFLARGVRVRLEPCP